MVLGRAGGGRPLHLTLLRAVFGSRATTGTHYAALRGLRTSLRGRAFAAKRPALVRPLRGRRSASGLAAVGRPSGGRPTRRRQPAEGRSIMTAFRSRIPGGAVSGTAHAKRGL